MPRLSIIIPAYNRAHCIGRALDSVRQQGLENFEIVLGDDASTDGTIEAVRRIFPDAKMAGLAVNSGAAAARNAAMKLATGEFLAFLDSDDEWLPGKLGAQLEFLRENPDVALCATSHVFCRRDGFRRELEVANPPNWAEALLESQLFHGASTPVVRREVLDSVGFQDESLRVLEDWDWMLRISQRHRIHVLPEHLAVIHENGPSNADFTRVSMGRFLKKHLKEIPSPSPRRRVESQHWENTARCFFRHSRNREGVACALQSMAISPRRNPALVAALPLALLDGGLGTKFLRRVLASRGGYSIV
jgi:glycosyltransferase involved in cell wall biosynthesis